MSARAKTFAACLSEAMRAQADALSDLAQRIDALVARARAEAQLAADDDAFVRHVAAHLPADIELETALAQVCAGDLYLACACGTGDADAVELFRRRMEPAAQSAAARVVPPHQVDDVVQETMGRLLVGALDSPPAILKYSGRGRLTKWVQTVAVRHAHTRSRRRSEQPSDNIEALAERMLEAGDPELDALKLRYRAAFKAAFRRCLEELSPRQRNLLRLELLDRKTLDAIARIYGVHAATISRWRADTRKQLLAGTRSAFEQELGVGREEFHSIVRMIQSQLEVSLPRLLEQDSGSGD